MSESTLVYSTETGRIKAEKSQPERPKGDGIVRIERQVSGRKGSGVSVIKGLDYLPDDELKKLAAELKKRCGCGGSVKNGLIEIQGEKRELLKQLLEQKGFIVKLSGG
ncbi:stress response translation initiation inhibitor YciH [Avibacterium volantium]|uniref:stress response translation initiation inhibitor YciH n=1 Tax=Avibacterium TaxID=292486 RepID=UPI0039FCAE5D